jgi:tRNA nucleotidyltransferase/poly(A) polymerase
MMNTNNIRTIATGKAFGVINVTNQGEYEIATFDMILALMVEDQIVLNLLILKGMLKDVTINALLRY